MLLAPTAWYRFHGVAEVARRFLEVCASLIPGVGIAYLWSFQDPSLRFEEPLLHEIAILVATLEGGFISYVSWRCYARSGEAFVKWLTLGFIGFTLVYSLHGFFTPVAQRHLWLFLLYGPYSRLLMSACLMIGILRFGEPADAPAVREDRRYWMGWFAFFLALSGGIAAVALSPLAGEPVVRLLPEAGSIVLCLVALAMTLRRRLRSPVISYFMLALVWFAFSSVAFMLARPWNHLWWMAHGVFATGFSVLGYGILRVFITSHSFEQMFTARELSESLAETNARLQEALAEVEQANQRQEAQMRSLEVSRAQFEALFKLSPDGIIVVEEGGSILKANPRAEEMFGYEPGSLAGLPVEELMPRELRAGHARIRRLHQYSAATRPMGAMEQPLACLRRDGRIFHAAISLSGLVFEGRQCIVTFVRDVSRLLSLDESRRREDRQSIERGRILEKVVAQVPGVVFQLRRSPDGRYDFPYVSPRAEEILGIAAGDLVASGDLWFSRLHPADLVGLINTIEHAAAARGPLEADWRAADCSGTMQPFTLKCATPELSEDGALVWTGYLRGVLQRAGDQKP